MVGGQHHNRQVLERTGPSDLFGDLEPINLRHATVEEQELVGSSRSRGSPPFSDGFVTGRSIRYLCSQGGQGFTKDQAVGGMVISHEGSDPLKIDRNVVLCGCRAGL